MRWLYLVIKNYFKRKARVKAARKRDPFIYEKD